MIVMGDPDKVLSEQILEATYGITIKVLRLLKGVNRKICVPILKQA